MMSRSSKGQWNPPRGPIDAPVLALRFPVLSNFEFWPSAIFYVPFVLQWLSLALRYRSLTLPTIANPLIEAGGLCGESKTQLFENMGEEARNWFARFGTFRTGSKNDLNEALRVVEELGLTMPIVLKPDIGCRGNGVQLICSMGQLCAYLSKFPQGHQLIVQEFIQGPGEAGVFYVRGPNDRVGHIWSLTLKYFPWVVGDGVATVRELILADPRAGLIPHIYLPRFADRLDDVPYMGEVVPIVFTGNHCKGAIFTDGQAYITPELTAQFESIARSIPEFHFGRFDIRFRSLADLQRGIGFQIVEMNGAGSEATHIWDREATLLSAWRSLARQLRMLFEIGHHNRKRGFQPMPTTRLIQMYFQQENLSKLLPQQIS
jgi:hypothetical protein